MTSSYLKLQDITS